MARKESTDTWRVSTALLRINEKRKLISRGWGGKYKALILTLKQRSARGIKGFGARAHIY